MMNQIINVDWFELFDTFREIMTYLILYLVFLITIIIFLKKALGYFSTAKHTDSKQVTVSSFLITLSFTVSSILFTWWFSWLIALILTYVILNLFHRTGFLKTILITILVFLIHYLVGIIFSALLIIFYPSNYSPNN